MKDSQGLDITAQQQEQVDNINEIIELFFRKRDGIARLLPLSAEQHQECPFLQIYTVVMYFFSFSTKAISINANSYILKLAKLQLNQREERYYQAIKEMQAANLDKAFDKILSIINEYPKDKIALLLLETLAFIGGHSERLIEIYEGLHIQYLDDPDFLGMLAFLYCHHNKKNEAKSLIEKGLQLSPQNAWLQHVHVHTLDLDDKEETIKIISYLESCVQDWPVQSRFFEGHNWMHLCQLYLGSHDNSEKIMDAYTQHIWGTAKEYNFEQNNAFLVLWSAELNDFEVPSYWWCDLAKYAQHFMYDYFTPYLTVTAILTVAKVTYSKAEKAAVDLENYITSKFKIDSEKFEAWGIGLQVLKGCLAYVKGNYKEASAFLKPVYNNTQLMGHSDEQRSIFPATYKKVIRNNRANLS